eukprot:8869707-Pyramimonas_sp.AAC.1
MRNFLRSVKVDCEEEKNPKHAVDHQDLVASDKHVRSRGVFDPAAFSEHGRTRKGRTRKRCSDATI